MAISQHGQIKKSKVSFDSCLFLAFQNHPLIFGQVEAEIFKVKAVRLQWLLGTVGNYKGAQK